MDNACKTLTSSATLTMLLVTRFPVDEDKTWVPECPRDTSDCKCSFELPSIRLRFGYVGHVCLEFGSSSLARNERSYSNTIVQYNVFAKHSMHVYALTDSFTPLGTRFSILLQFPSLPSWATVVTPNDWLMSITEYLQPARWATSASPSGWWSERGDYLWFMNLKYPEMGLWCSFSPYSHLFPITEFNFFLADTLAQQSVCRQNTTRETSNT